MDQYNERIPLANAWSIGSLLVLFAVTGGGALIGGAGGVATAGLIIIALLSAYLLVTMLLCRLRITQEHITVGVFPFRTRIALSSKVREESVALQDWDHPKLRWRKMGVGLPGMQLGWFTTSRGKPVFAATAGGRGRVLIPTNGEHDLLVSCRDPERVVAVLRSQA